MINKCSKNNHTKNHLIEISKLILDYIKQNNNKTGSQITEYIINILKEVIQKKELLKRKMNLKRNRKYLSKIFIKKRLNIMVTYAII